jgi:hypothetical protein
MLPRRRRVVEKAQRDPTRHKVEFRAIVTGGADWRTT